MKKIFGKFNVLLCLTLFVYMSISFASCSDDNDNAINVYEYKEQIGKKIKELSDLQTNSEYGLANGQYPEESKALLEAPIADLKDLLSIIESKKIAENEIPAETANRLEKADKAIEAFKASLRGEDDDIKKLTDKILELTILKNDSDYGMLEGQYPEESKAILDASITEMEDLLAKIENNELTGNEKETATTESIRKADEAIEAFKATIRTEDYLVKAELLINGKNQGYIDFGAHPEFSRFGNDGEQQFTVEFWTKIVNMDGFVFFLSTLTDDGAQRKGWNINSHFNTLRPTYAMGVFDLMEPGIPFNTLNQWVHIALVTNELGVDGETHADGRPIMTKMYVNGELVISEPSNQPADRPYASAVDGIPLYGFMGATAEGTPQWDKGANAYMKHMHIWNKAKSQNEIQRIIDNPDSVIGTESDLVCGWRFDTVVKDNNDIKDITGKYSAKLVGDFVWKPLE